MEDRLKLRTWLCSVVFLDIVGYSKQSVEKQMEWKERFNGYLAEGIQELAEADRVILDTGDGAAICFLGDPEAAMFCAMKLRSFMVTDEGARPEGSGMRCRIGVNLGSVKLIRDINNNLNAVGDGINVAQRIMSFARPGQIVVSRSYYDVVSNLASEYAKLFHYEGSRTDKHVREHEIYVVGHHEGALQKARDGMKDRASSTSPNRKGRNGTGTQPGTNTVTLTIPSFVQDKKKLTMVAGGLAALVLVLGLLVIAKKPSSSEALRTASAPPVETPARPATTPPQATAPAGAAPVEAPKGAEPVSKPAIDSNVVLPQPAPSQIPPAKAEPSKSETTKAEAIHATPSKNDVKPNEAARDARPAAEKPNPGVIPATLFFNVTPWGEIFVNGKSQGVTPPKKSLKLDPGKYKIEIRNTTFPAHVETLELKSRDEVTVRYKFQ